MKQHLENRILLIMIAAFLVLLGGQLFWGVLQWAKTYYVMQAAAWFIIYAGLTSLLNGKKRIIADALALFALNNLIDDLFFNPTVLSYNELAFFLLILLSTIYRIRRKSPDEKRR